MEKVINHEYSVVSRGIDKPERLPVVGEHVSLLVLDRGSIIEAEVIPNYVEMLGPYVHLIGQVIVAQFLLSPCNAKYVLDERIAEGNVIGNLVIKENTEQDLFSRS